MGIENINLSMIFGGFGLFMFGITFMGDGLKSIAGDKLREYIDKYTSKPLIALCIGFAITVMMQSSSASTAITIGFVRAGLMTLEQAASIIMGANIGTTVTAFLFGLSFEKYSLYFVFLGAILIAFTKRKKHRYIGEIIFGFGALFYGLKIMGDALKTLKDLPQFEQFATAMTDNPYLGLLTSTVLTAIIQSSGALIAVAQKIYEAGGISFIGVLPFVFGANIGTTITGVFAAMGGSTAAKRSAGIHIMFNIIGTIIGMALLVPYSNFMMYISEKYNISPLFQIAIAHIIFNVSATLIFFPFLKQMCDIIRKIIKGDEPKRVEINIDNLNTGIENTLPSVAIDIAEKAISKMFDSVKDIIVETKDFLVKKGTGDGKEFIQQTESLINSFDKKITKYLTAISIENITESDIKNVNASLQVVKNLERIGDLSMNVTEFIEMVYEDKEKFSDEAHNSIIKMLDLLQIMLDKSMDIYINKNYDIFDELQKDEDSMDRIEYEARSKHFRRMHSNECVSAVAASVYCDILSNIERMADHCLNIGKRSNETKIVNS